MQKEIRCRASIEPWMTESQGDIGKVKRVIVDCRGCDVRTALSASQNAPLGTFAREFKRVASTFCQKIGNVDEREISDTMLPKGLSPEKQTFSTSQGQILQFPKERRSGT